MGRARITGGGTDGLYTIRIERDLARAKRTIDALTIEQGRIAAKITAALEVRAGAADALLLAAGAATAAWGDAAAAGPDDYQQALRRASEAELAAQKAAGVLQIADLDVSRLRLRDQQIRADIIRLQAVPEYVDTAAWCADLTEDLPPDALVGLLIPGDERYTEPPIVRPAFADRAAYVAARDGILAPVVPGAPASYARNTVLLPGRQRWLPRHRIGTIVAVSGDSCVVTLADQRSSRQQLPTVPLEGGSLEGDPVTLHDVPIEYMDCHGDAFAPGDRVVVAFQHQDPAQPKVVGFHSHPKPCDLRGIIGTWRDAGSGSTGSAGADVLLTQTAVTYPAPAWPHGNQSRVQMYRGRRYVLSWMGAGYAPIWPWLDKTIPVIAPWQPGMGPLRGAGSGSSNRPLILGAAGGWQSLTSGIWINGAQISTPGPLLGAWLLRKPDGTDWLRWLGLSQSSATITLRLMERRINLTTLAAITSAAQVAEIAHYAYLSTLYANGWPWCHQRAAINADGTHVRVLFGRDGFHRVTRVIDVYMDSAGAITTQSEAYGSWSVEVVPATEHSVAYGIETTDEAVAVYDDGDTFAEIRKHNGSGGWSFSGPGLSLSGYGVVGLIHVSNGAWAIYTEMILNPNAPPPFTPGGEWPIYSQRLYTSTDGMIELLPPNGTGNVYFWFDHAADSTRWAKTLAYSAAGAPATVVCDSWRGDPRGLGGPGGNAWLWPIAIR